MAFWKRHAKTQSTAEASTPSTPSVEHAVLIRIASLSDPGAGLDLVEDPIIEAIARAGVGEFDGNEIGPDGATLYMYGPDADALWSAVEAAVRRSPLGAGSYVVKRYGPPGARESRVELA